ncbi:MAG: c-type cytochrome [Desulfobacterales bacterium]|nr:c-type cytochrome [Desulfobacterales bacterium]
MKYFISVLFASFFLIGFSFIVTSNGICDIKNGKTIYEQSCMDCHGKDGKGVLAPPHLESDRFKSQAGVVALVDYIMPATSPDFCTGTNAEDVSAYCTEEFKYKIPKETIAAIDATDAEGRKLLFDQTCSVCHGVDGKGDLARPIVGSTLFKTGEDVVKFIDGLMPFHNPRKCKDECAANTARYVIDSFDLKLSDR